MELSFVDAKGGPAGKPYNAFGILQSGIHWAWFMARCSTLTALFRYTSDTVFDTFPWPQTPTLAQVKAVAEVAVSLRALLREIMAANGWSLRDLYRTLETPGTNRLRLNLELAALEASGKEITGPGLPAPIANPTQFMSPDCIRPLV